jgi:hypothetical protein
MNCLNKKDEYRELSHLEKIILYHSAGLPLFVAIKDEIVDIVKGLFNHVKT